MYDESVQKQTHPRLRHALLKMATHLLTVLVLTSCGVKGPPLPPESAATKKEAADKAEKKEKSKKQQKKSDENAEN